MVKPTSLKDILELSSVTSARYVVSASAVDQTRKSYRVERKLFSILGLNLPSLTSDTNSCWTARLRGVLLASAHVTRIRYSPIGRQNITSCKNQSCRSLKIILEYRLVRVKMKKLKAMPSYLAIDDFPWQTWITLRGGIRGKRDHLQRRIQSRFQNAKYILVRSEGLWL